MKILVACEESQAVTIELRKLEHEAYSCDIEPCSGGHPEWHLQQDVIPLLSEPWDMILAFPPCTYLTVAGNRWFKPEYKDRYPTREQDRAEAIEFFMLFATANCPKIVIENPIGIMSSRWRRPDQVIQPYQFGHPYTKQTCLWLKGLPLLEPTEILEQPSIGWENQNFSNGRYAGFGKTWGGQREDGTYRRYGDPELKKIRSKTFPGIAKAMAEQWAGKA